MNRVFALGAVFGVFLCGPVVADYSVGTVDITALYTHRKGWGGEYTIYNTALSTAAYDVKASDRGTIEDSFQSFCLELNEVVATPESGLVALVGTGAIRGGVAGGNPDPISDEVAWLYTQFATGNLAGYAYESPVGGLTRKDTAGALQRLIWSLEEEGYGTGWEVDVANTWGGGVNWASSSDVVKQPLIASLIDTWESLYASSGWSGIGNVRVLNLQRWDTTLGKYVDAQSQLYLFPVPVPGAVLLGMLGLGYAGLKLRRRCA